VGSSAVCESTGSPSEIATVKAPEGDFRNWAVIRDWAEGIASELECLFGAPSRATASGDRRSSSR
jgi:hypothetical protein